MQQSEPPSTANSGWFRLALFLTGDDTVAGEILRAVSAIAPEELAQLRGNERRKTWLIRQIRARALKWRQENPLGAESTDSTSFSSRVSALPEPARSAVVLFHCFDSSLEDCAAILGMDMGAFTQALGQARHALSPGSPFPKEPLLMVHRPWGGDRPGVAKAASGAQANPEFAAQVAADQQWHDEVERVIIPEELQLLHWVEPPRPGLRALILQPAVLAIALALVVVLGVVIHMAKTRMGDFPGKDAVMAFVEDAGSLSGSEFKSIVPPTDAGRLDDWFVSENFMGFSVPPELQKAQAVGWRVENHNDVVVAQVALDKQNAMLLVIHTANVKIDGETSGWQPAFQQDKWAVATYIDKEIVCVVMFEGDSDDMPKFLKTVGK